MGDGRIAESGTHEELLAKGGKYAAMWNAEQKISVSIRLIETVLSFTTVLCLLQRLPEIRDDIVDILNAHG